MDDVNKILKAASNKVLARISEKMKKRELEAAMKLGMDNAIYQYPLKQHRPNSDYRRTGNLKKAVRLTRFLPGPANPVLKIRLVVNNSILSRQPNPRSNGRRYAQYTGYGINTGGVPNKTVMGLGWVPFSRSNIIKFIMQDALRQGLL